MNKRKTIITILSTLLIGLIIGFFLSGRLTHNRMKHRHAMMTKPGAEQKMLIKQLQLNAEQITQISPILDTMISSQIEMRKFHRNEMNKARKDMFKKMKPHLNTKQLQRLEEIQHRMKPQRK
jgi:uncharacterized protein YneF (UPF0154 family)